MLRNGVVSGCRPRSIGPPDELRRAGIEPVVPLAGSAPTWSSTRCGRSCCPRPEHRVDAAHQRSGNCPHRPDGDDLHLACLNTWPAGPSLGGAFAALMHPASRGRVRLAGNAGNLEVRFHCLTTQHDLDRLWTGLEQLYELVRGPAFAAITTGPPTGLDGQPPDLTAPPTERSAWMRRMCLPGQRSADFEQRDNATPVLQVASHHHRSRGPADPDRPASATNHHPPPAA